MRLRNVVPLLFLTVGCGSGASQDLSESSYRVTAPSSAGLSWKVHRDAIRVCYSDSTNSDTHKNDVVYSIQEWVRGLTDVAQEPLATDVQIVAANAACDVKVYIGNYSPAFTQLGLTPSVYLNYSGWFGSKTVTLHEFGHAFGLLDTYNGSGGSCQSGQPDSVMCRAYYEELQADDVAGIQDIYRRVRAANGVMVRDDLEGVIVQ